MAAYVIGEIEVTDPATYEDYRKQVGAVVAKYGGKFIARGGQTQALEGGWSPKRLVILELGTMEQALKWYRSPRHSPLIQPPPKASRGKMVAIEGAQKE